MGEIPAKLQEKQNTTKIVATWCKIEKKNSKEKTSFMCIFANVS